MINLQIQQIQSGFLVGAVFIVLYFIEQYSHKERMVCESVARQKKVVLMSSSDLKCCVTIFNAHIKSGTRERLTVCVTLVCHYCVSVMLRCSTTLSILVFLK